MPKLLSFETSFETYIGSKVIGQGGSGRVYEASKAPRVT
jgi:hypothetical protein